MLHKIWTRHPGEPSEAATECVQVGANIRCVYACVGHSEAAQQDAIQRLQAGGAMKYTTVVAAPRGAPHHLFVTS